MEHRLLLPATKAKNLFTFVTSDQNCILNDCIVHTFYNRDRQPFRNCVPTYWFQIIQYANNIPIFIQVKVNVPSVWIITKSICKTWSFCMPLQNCLAFQVWHTCCRLPTLVLQAKMRSYPVLDMQMFDFLVIFSLWLSQVLRLTISHNKTKKC